MYATGDIVKTRQSTPYDHVPGWRIVVAVEVPADAPAAATDSLSLIRLKLFSRCPVMRQ